MNPVVVRVVGARFCTSILDGRWTHVFLFLVSLAMIMFHRYLDTVFPLFGKLGLHCFVVILTKLKDLGMIVGIAMNPNMMGHPW